MNAKDIEITNYIKEHVSEEGFRGYLMGNILKYGFYQDSESVLFYGKLLREIMGNDINLPCEELIKRQDGEGE